MSILSWKSVEMQVALPRTQDAGRIQEQMTKQGQNFQNSLTEQQLIEEKRKQQRVNEFEDIERLKNDQKDGDSPSEEEKKDNESQPGTEEDEQIKHPYLGANIDYSR